MPLLPLLSVLTAAGFLGEGLCETKPAFPEQISSKPALAARLQLYGCVIVIIAGSLLSLPPVYAKWMKEWTYWHSYQSPIRFLLGRQSAEDYLRRDVPSIYVYGFINRNLNSKDRILLLNDASQFYSRIPTLYSFTVEGEGILHQTTEEGMLEKLRQSRITHVLLNYNGIAPLRGVAPRFGVYFFLDKSFQGRYLEPIYSENNVVLYRVRTS